MKTSTPLLNTFRQILISAMIILTTGAYTQNQTFTYNEGKQGLSLNEQKSDKVLINYSINSFSLEEMDIKGEQMQKLSMPGHFLPNDAGAPDLPGDGKFVAIPEGAKASLNILSMDTEIIKDVNLAPAFVIPKDDEEGELKYEKDPKIYSKDAFYPAEPVRLSESMQIRGVDAVMLGVTPFQYNPVTKELKVFSNIKLEVSWEGGNGHYGENRLRNKYWDPIVKDALLNPQVLPEIDYYSKSLNNRNRDAEAEYVIIIPDDEDFLAWADTLKSWRIKQGITTMVITTEEIGGNTVNDIESWIDDAYYSWENPPAAVLLLADFGNIGNTVISPIYNSYCVSDHIFADVDDDHMADIVFARITAQDEADLENMINKIIDYESDPPTASDFYDHPITALGWQTERWFQICSETVGGYLKNVHGKNPVRINEIYQGTPGSIWSSNQNTHMVVDYFGPDGLGYIPATPAELGNWSGGNAQMVNDAINDGAFILQHRDHGGVNGWGEPDYTTSDLTGLSNEDLVFVFSINCLTGKFNVAGECFTEAFHRHQQGALGLIAASEVSYSFVNDTYVWGMFDNMWPDFMPDYETIPEPRGLLPAFGNVAGKYFLLESNWPYNTNSKEVTYYLFHHHGGAFSTLYSEVPQQLTVNHDDVLLAGLDYFTVTADEGSTIALTTGDEIIGIAEGTGGPVDIPITPQLPPTMVEITITKTNYFRYSETVQVIPPDGPYVIKDDYNFTDENGNGQMDYGEEVVLSLSMKNVGNEDADNVLVNLSTEDEYLNITDNEEAYGTIEAQGTVMLENGFTIELAENYPNEHIAVIKVEANNEREVWESSITIQGFAPMLTYADFSISDPTGNNNGKLDPGETADLLIRIKNEGKASAFEVTGTLASFDQYVTINTDEVNYGEVEADGIVEQSFSVTANSLTPAGHTADYEFSIGSASGHIGEGSFSTVIGQIPILIIDLEQNHSSAPILQECIDNFGITAQYTTSMPSQSLNVYNTIFVCLGVYSSNHVLSSSNGQNLADFVENGGNLYMEGGDTWFYDDQTAVHSFFNINATDDGTNGEELDMIKGISGTITEGMTYTYSGENNWIDHLEPISPAIKLMENNSPNFGTVIGHDAGDYKTIGSSFEFGGLDDDTYTKDQLMAKYLEFFGFTGVPAQPSTPEGNEEVCSSENGSEYSVEALENTDYYIWVIEPEQAGIITGNDTLATVDWNATFEGSAVVKVCGMNATGPGPFSDALEVMVTRAPSASLSGETDLCRGDSLVMSIDLEGVAPWQIIMNDATDTLLAESAPFEIKVSPQDSMAYSVTYVADQSGCGNVGEDSYMVNVLDSPDISLGPDTSICCNHMLEAEVPDHYASYLWSDGSTGTSIQIDSTGVGFGDKEVWVKVTHDNGCEKVDYITVTFTECAGLDEVSAGRFVDVYPVPSKGLIYIIPKTEMQERFNLRVVNAYGTLVYHENDISLQAEQQQSIDLSAMQSGVYYLIFENEFINFTRKVIIRK